ncbi:MAG: hypothetical protein DRZ79_04365 [Candidatus Cloacimonadota bacterium]|nr:MAG: hypothetical protein DRZ79_04365 [Candidatus Cloacimonadota bacterium]
MHILFGSLFWGVLLILLGFSIVIKAIFKIDIPVIKIVFALLLIYWGIKILFGFNIGHHSSGNAIFEESKFKASKSKNEYNLVFGNGEIDLSELDVSQKNAYSEVNIVFGSGDIYINPSVPTIIKVSSVFAETRLPGKTINFIGDYVYKSKDFSPEEPHLYLKLNVVFGSARVKEI